MTDEGGISLNSGPIDSPEETRRKENERAAISIYEDIMKAAERGLDSTRTRDICVEVLSITEFDTGVVAFQSEESEIRVTIRSSSQFFVEENLIEEFSTVELSSGFIEVYQERHDQPSETWLFVPHPGGYLGGRIIEGKDEDLRLESKELCEDAEVLELLEKSKILVGAPHSITARFPSYSAFLESLVSGLGEEPIPGIVTDALEDDFAIFWGDGNKNALALYADLSSRKSAQEVKKGDESELGLRRNTTAVNPQTRYL